jgi:hypothetical protein
LVDAEIIDLVAVAAACRPLAAWWHQFATGGDASPSDLEHARKHLATLAPTHGPIGRAIDRIVSVESETNTGQVLAALDLLGRIAASIPGSAASSVPMGPSKTGRRAGEARCQPALPGLD